MNAKNIVLATDFSDYASDAMRYAVSIARDTGATVHLVHAVEDPPHSADRGFGGFQAEAEVESDAEKTLAEIKLPDENIPVVRKLLHGAPDVEIVQYAKEVEADMVVLGTHGHTGLMRVLLGSVAESVVRKAHCPVLTVKQPEG